MTTEISINVTEIDIQKWMDNALDPETWGDNHTIYKDEYVEVTIQLTTIDTLNNRLHYEVRVELADYKYLGSILSGYDDNGFSIKRDNFNTVVILNTIKSKIETGLKYSFRQGIRGTETYNNLTKSDSALNKNRVITINGIFDDKLKNNSFNDEELEYLRERYAFKYKGESSSSASEYTDDTAVTLTQGYMDRINSTLVIKDEY